jgi:hypothetical protein
MKFTQLFILILAFLIINPAQAGLLVEPVLGYSMSKLQVDTAGSEEEEGSGVSIGGRLGYQNLGFQLGIDYLKSTISIDDTSFKSDLDSNEISGFVGFEFPILFRVYAGYILSASAEADYGSPKNTLSLTDGSGMKLGVGFTGLPFVDINFEYRKGTYATYKYVTEQEIDTDFSAYMISLSLPFVL